MIFNSFVFFAFLIVTFSLYWFVFSKNLKLQNLLLIAAGYVFYGWWDWRFVFLLLLSTSLDYFFGLRIYNTSSRRKLWMYLSIIINLGILGWFKYYNFFIDSAGVLLQTMGFQPNISSLNIVLPIGISFYTFHGLSYVIDIYYERVKPTKNFVDYAVFVCFFPLLVAGPIERASHLLPQVQAPRKFDLAQASDGMRQMLWGFFKKIVIADSCAPLVNIIFHDYTQYSGSILLLGAILFAFQIYGDFSGYSDIALGVARLFGFDLIRNFAFPYFSRDIAEFWRRWHISLSSWFKDYVYIPLGGSRGSITKGIVNTLIIFLISGFWHGANWTFITWGAFHGLLFIPLFILDKNRNNINIVAEGKILPSFKEFMQMGITFLLVTLGWIFFRAENVHLAWDYLRHLATPSLFTIPTQFRGPLPWIVVLLLVEWVQRHKQHGLQIDGIKSQAVRWSVYLLLIIVTLANFTLETGFIYFQF